MADTETAVPGALGRCWWMSGRRVNARGSSLFDPTPSRYNIQWEIKFFAQTLSGGRADRHQYPLVPSGL